MLRQSVALVGVPFGLHYRNDRVSGRMEAYALSIPLTGFAEVPSSLKQVQLEVAIARRRFSQTFPPARAQTGRRTGGGPERLGASSL